MALRIDSCVASISPCVTEIRSETAVNYCIRDTIILVRKFPRNFSGRLSALSKRLCSNHLRPCSVISPFHNEVCFLEISLLISSLQRSTDRKLT